MREQPNQRSFYLIQAREIQNVRNDNELNIIIYEFGRGVINKKRVNRKTKHFRREANRQRGLGFSKGKGFVSLILLSITMIYDVNSPLFRSFLSQKGGASDKRYSILSIHMQI